MQNIQNFIKSDKTYKVIFWMIVVLGMVFIMRSYPMMKTRFDIWFHLGNIDDLVHGINLPYSRVAWYSVWATIFKCLSIQDISNYATIIHRTQFVVSCAAIYLASAYLLPTTLLKTKHWRGDLQDKKHWISSFALSSTLVWLTVIGTVSTFQQAWIMWYSVNYQITLPFFFLAVSLTLNVIAFDQSKAMIGIKLICSTTLFLLVLLFHAGELVYLTIYMLAVLVFYLNKKNINVIFFVLFFLVLFVYILSHFYSDRIPEIVTLIQTGQSGKISILIEEYGKYNIEGGNRFSANWNALYVVCVCCSLPILMFHAHDKNTMNSKMLYILLASLIYCFIPTFKYSSGVVSLFYGAPIVNRIYFASLLFVLPSLLAYLILRKTSNFNYPIYLLILVFGLMATTAAYSRYVNNGGTYFQNINSIRNSLKPEKIGVDLPAIEIDSIKAQIDAAKTQYGESNIMFCANYDKSHIIQYVYRQKNILFDRFAPHEVADCEKNPKAKDKRIVYID